MVYHPTMALRFDITKLDDPRRDHNGYLVADAHATRTGVFVYHHPDGSTTRELRHPDEVFKPESIASLKHRPVTDGHPPDAKLNSENTKRFAIGMAIDNPEKNDIYIDTKIQLTDEDVISRVLDEENPLREMSCGYEAEVVKKDGTYQGEEYDHEQTNIKYNHLAIVRRGRAGHEVRMMLDAADAAGDGLEDIVKTDVEETEENIHIPARSAGQFKEGSFRTTALKGVKGVQLVVGRLKSPPKGQKGSAVAQKFIFSKKHFTKEQAHAFMKKHRGDEAELVKTGKINQTNDIDGNEPRGDRTMIKIKRDAVAIDKYKMDAFQVEIEDNVESGEKAVNEVMGRLDAAHEHILVLKSDKEKMGGTIEALKENGKVTLATLNDQVKERTTAVSAANYLGLKDFQDMETDDLKKAVVTKAYPQVKIDDLSKGHIEGRYDTIIEGMNIEGENLKSTLALKNQSGGNKRFPLHSDNLGPREKFLKDTKDMHLSKEERELQAN